MPTGGTDPSGKDVIWLFDTTWKGIGKTRGHAAVIAGNEKYGWWYLSFSTGDNSLTSKDNADVRHWVDFADLMKCPQLKRYTRFAWYFTNDEGRYQGTIRGVDYIKGFLKSYPSYEICEFNCLVASALAVRFCGFPINNPSKDEVWGELGEPPTWTDPNTHIKWVENYAKQNPKKVVFGEWTKDLFTKKFPPTETQWIQSVNKK